MDKFCTYCGAQLADAARFCGSCGSGQGEDAPGTTEPSQAPDPLPQYTQPTPVSQQQASVQLIPVQFARCFFDTTTA